MAADNSERFVLLNYLADEFAARYRRGERPGLQEYIDQYPELADDIREFFPAMVQMEQIKDDRPEVVEPASGLLLTTERLGDFRIIREIGHGGMGVVYEAEQVSLGRHVALKVLPQQRLADAQTRHRFEREARAAARLHHTNIVPVFGVGEDEGLPYYVMQFIQGLGLDQVLEELKQLQPGAKSSGILPRLTGSEPPASRREVSAANVARLLITGAFRPAAGEADALDQTVDQAAAQPVPAPTAARAPDSGRLSEASALSSSSVVLPGAAGQKPFTYWQSVALLGGQVADALEYTHKQGIQHRDIKPSNLLLDTRGTVWVTDFGLARAENEAHLTQTGDIVGTLRYMPPEAFEGKTDARSDIYSLGLTLYELLALRPAFDERDRPRLIKQVTTAELPRLDALNPAIPGDLVTIVQKATAREPGRRYATAGELSADLQRFLSDEPILARRQTHLERYWRWARRNPGIAVLGGVLTAVLVAVTVASLLAAGHFNRLRLNERDARHEAELSRQSAEASADEARRRGDAERWERYQANIASAASALQLNNVGRARESLAAAPIEHRGWEWLHFANQLDDARSVLRGHQGPVNVVAFSPDGRRIASGSYDRTVRLWDTVTGQEQLALRGSQDFVLAIAFSPDGTRIGSGSLHGAVLWNAATGKQIAALGGSAALPFSSAGIRVGKERGFSKVRFRDVVTGQEFVPQVDDIGDIGIVDVAIAPDGRRIATAGTDHTVRLWDARSGAPLATLRGHEASVYSVCFSPDGRRLASGGDYPDNTVRLWNMPPAGPVPAEPIAVMRGHGNIIESLAFSADGTRVASASWDQTVRIWDGTSGKPIATLRGHAGQVRQVAFSPDGKRLVSASQDRTLRLWDVDTGNPIAVARGHTDEVQTVAFSPDGTLFASGSNDGTVRVWEVQHLAMGNVLRGHSSFVYDVAFSPDGSRLASAAWDGTVRLWDATTGRQTGLVRSDEKIVASVVFSREGDQLAFLARDDAVHWCELTNGQQVRKVSVPSKFPFDSRIAISSKGDLFGAGSYDGRVRIWDMATDEPVAVLSGHTRAVRDVAFDPTGKLLASASRDGTVRVWDVAKKESIQVLYGHSVEVRAVAFSPNGRFLASGSSDGTARLWDAATFKLIRVLRHGGNVYKAAFSPDGSRLATGCADNTIRLWSLTTYQEVAELRGHESYVHSLAWSPDGTRLASASGDHTVRIWDTVSPAVRARPKNAYLPPKGYVAYRATAPIIMDGKLDDDAWKAAPWSDDFVDIEGDRRLPPRFRTRVKMLWDDKYLYIGAELEEPHVQGTYTKRDSYIFHEDNDFEVFLNPDGNNHNYAELEMNARNTVWDLRLNKPYRDGGKAEDAWDIPGLKTAVHVNGTLNNPRDLDKGWTLEIAIPWEIVRALNDKPARAPRDGEQWRINFSRVEWRFDIVDGKYVRRKDRREDNWVWSPQGVVNMHQPETWGYVQFSTASPGKAAFRPDEAGPAKHLLHRIYHAQKEFKKKHNRYARSLAELKLADLEDATLAGPPVLEAESNRFRATVDVKLPSGRQHWHICEDSRVWKNP